ncbi:retrotransposon protein [Cucumis melo var. makuwa]|uniref:Retrotransposon protein n=1 Tax=Cucumis melo var. makuwa TaxID=1194695 RepID=A0A5A7VBE6_CUCMM|nr:retrotransposon protein [Cucumis melo var. makuwa]
MNDNRRITHTPSDTRHRIRQLAYFRMIHESDFVCHQCTRMDRRTFAILCHLLQTASGLSSTEIVDIEEMVAMFLHVLAHDELIKRPDPVTNNCSDQRWKCFENCLGALDRTYIKVNVPATDRPTFRTRKEEIAINVLDVCDTKGDFVYVLIGWEGSATKDEEGTLVEGLMELVSLGGWKSDNGMFRPGYLAQLVRMMAEKLPGCQGQRAVDLGGTMKRNIAEKALFDNWVRSHPAANGLLNKSFSYYDELTYVFGRDRETGQFAETFIDVGSNEPGGYDRFDMGDGNDEFPPMYSQVINLSQDDVRASQPSRASEGRTGLSGSKRKRGSQRKVDVEGIHLALDETNDQLRMIV